MALLITVDDIRAIRPIAQALDDIAKIEPYIDEAQQTELKDLIGVEFFYRIIGNVSDFADLLNGIEYQTSNNNTIAFKGLKIVLAYFSYARFLVNDNIKHTNAGFVVKRTDYSEPVSQSQITAKYQDARSMALSYWSDVVLYLDTKKSLYPLWRISCSSGSNGIRSGAKISSVNNRDRFH